MHGDFETIGFRCCTSLKIIEGTNQLYFRLAMILKLLEYTVTRR